MPADDDANDETRERYLSLSGDTSEEKSSSLRKRKEDATERKKSLENSLLESTVNVTKRRAFFSFKNFCCTIL